MGKISVVLFDVGGVLSQDSNDAVKAAVRRELGIDEATFAELWSTLIPLLGAGEIDEATFWDRAQNELGIRPVQESEDLLSKTFADQLLTHPQIIELIPVIRQSGATTAILSNTIEPHARINRQTGMYDNFDHVLLSHEIGLRKPDPAIFDYAVDVLGVPPEEILFTDDIPTNVEVAQSFGMQGIVFTSPEAFLAELQSAFPELLAAK